MKIQILITLSFILMACTSHTRTVQIDANADDVATCYQDVHTAIDIVIDNSQHTSNKDVIAAVRMAHGGDVGILIRKEATEDLIAYQVRRDSIVRRVNIEGLSLPRPVLNLEYLDGSIDRTLSDENCYAIGDGQSIYLFSGQHFDYLRDQDSKTIDKLVAPLLEAIF